MFFMSLSRSDKRMISDIAKLYQNTITAQDLGADNALNFWRMSMYSKVGWLKNQDVRDILDAMEAFAEILRRNPRKDPTGAYSDLPGVIERFKALMKKHHVMENEELKKFDEEHLS